MTEDRPKLATLWPEAPAPLAEAIDRGLVRDVAARWTTIRDFMTALRSAADAAGVDVPALRT
ncbi:MAG: hypothetical protein R3B82_25090 [Sandaracinaceae bacterium]